MEPLQIEQNNPNQPTNFRRKFGDYLFYSQCVGVAFLVGFLYPIVGYPVKSYLPSLSSIGISAFLGFLCQWITASRPSEAIWVVFRLSPALPFIFGSLIVATSSFPRTAGSLVAGLVMVIFSIILFVYGNWVKPRFQYATQILLLSMEFSPAEKNAQLLMSFLLSILHSIFFVACMGGVVALMENNKKFIIALSVLLVYQFWVFQAIRNKFLVTLSGLKYIHYTTRTEEMNTDEEIRASRITICMENIYMGSILVPISGLVYDSSRALNLLARVYRHCECLSRCANRYSGLASRLIRLGNVWGFVRMGVENRDIGVISNETWDMLTGINGLEELIGSDITGSLCFFLGVAGGAICGLVSGALAILLVVPTSHALEISIYAFFNGYLMVHIAMAWPHACVLAYYVAYAANPQAQAFVNNNTIPNRIAELGSPRYQPVTAALIQEDEAFTTSRTPEQLAEEEIPETNLLTSWLAFGY